MYVLEQQSQQLDLHELRKRAQRISLVLTDCDGVLTDNGVYYSANGEEMKRFSVRDGMGVERLRLGDVETAIMTRENSASVRKRAEKLKLRYVYCSVRDKQAHLAIVLNQTGLKMHHLAYIGDDVNDFEIIQSIGEVGLTACPQDAMPAVQGIAHYQCAAPGGYGAFRDFAEWLLRLREEA
jgi:3-deoxy-D-manno-octulosonate 8-phosphate phosphatase (KDO 8-P phosphatase)